MFLLCISSLKQPSRSVTASWTSTNTEKHLSDSRKDKVDGIVTPTQAARSWAQTYELFFSVKIYELVCVLGYAFVFMSVCVCVCVHGSVRSQKLLDSHGVVACVLRLKEPDWYRCFSNYLFNKFHYVHENDPLN